MSTCLCVLSPSSLPTLSVTAVPAEMFVCPSLWQLLPLQVFVRKLFMWDVPELTINVKIIVEDTLVFEKKLYLKKKWKGFEIHCLYSLQCLAWK